MKKKLGFTLVELIASLVVLSVISIIVTVNIQKSIKNSSNSIYELQLDTYSSSVEQWLAEATTINSSEDLIMPLYLLSEKSDTLVSFLVESNNIVTEEKIMTVSETKNYGYSFIFIPVIEVDGIIDADIVSQSTKEKYTDYTFIVVKQSLIEESLNNNSNYKYSYETIDTNEKMLNFFAEMYFDENPLETTVTQTDLYPIMPDNLLRIVDESPIGIINIETTETINEVEITDNGDGTYEIN